jgi:hypothetical protein
MESLLFLVSVFFTILEKLKGPMTFRLTEVNENTSDSYRVELNNGAAILLFCQELVYSKKYKRWWIPNRRQLMYRVYGDCVGDVPKGLEKIVTNGLILSNQMPKGSGLENQRRSAIEAFISHAADELSINTHSKITS